MHTVSKVKKGVKYRAAESEERLTEKPSEWLRRWREPVLHMEEYLRFMRERMGPEVEEIRAQWAKEREQRAKQARQKGSKPA